MVWPVNRVWPNKRMHATADTRALKFLLGAGRRVMRGVRRFAVCSYLILWDEKYREAQGQDCSGI